MQRFPAAVGVSPTVQSIFDRILATIHDGGLRPGTMVRDLEIARDLGVSRTPVREAFQMLREAGVLEVSASRYTRIAVLTPAMTEQARRAWVPIQAAVLEEIVSRPEPPDAAAVTEMEAMHAESVGAVLGFDNPRLATANARLYAITAELAGNPYLVKAAGSVAHALRLGLMSLPAPVDFGLLLQAQRETIDAVAGQDPAMAAKAMSTLKGIPIPTAPAG